MIQKPKFNSPCNHCGLCCREQICQLGELMFPGQSAPCPGIIVKDGKSLCGLVLMEQAAKSEPLFQHVLGIGTGCSMPDEDTTEAEMARADEVAQEFVSTHYPIK